MEAVAPPTPTPTPTLTPTPSPSPIGTEGWKTYRNEQYGFEVKYPEGWVVEPSHIPNSYTPLTVRFIAVEREQEVGISVHDDSRTVDEFISELVDVVATELKQDIRLSGAEGIMLKQIVNSPPRVNHKVDLNIYTRRGEFIYRIGGFIGDRQAIDPEAESMLNGIIASFRFIE